MINLKIFGYDFSIYIEMNPDDLSGLKNLYINRREEIIYLKNNIYRKISSGNFKFQYFVQYIRDVLECLFIETYWKSLSLTANGVRNAKLEEQNTHETVYLCAPMWMCFL